MTDAGAGRRPRVTVVGAGASGLAVAVELRARGLAPTVLDRAAAVGTTWRGRYDGLRLHTGRRLSGLPGAPIPRRCGQWVARDEFVAYLEDYADRFGIEPSFGTTATRIVRQGSRWLVHTSRGPLTSDAVVVATGNTSTPRLPSWPGRSGYARPLLHSVDYLNPAPYAGRLVLVVGSGNSAAEIATELSETGASVTLSVRTPPVIVRRDVLGVPSQRLAILLRRAPAPVVDRLMALLRRVSVPDLSSAGLPAPAHPYTELRRRRAVPVLDHGFVRRVRAGDIRVVPAVASFTPDRVILEGAGSIAPDVVIACTGYGPDLGGLVGSLGVLDPDGSPLVHGARTSPRAPGLYFVGMQVELTGLLREARREAREVARAIAGTPAVRHGPKRSARAAHARAPAQPAVGEPADG